MNTDARKELCDKLLSVLAATAAALVCAAIDYLTKEEPK